MATFQPEPAPSVKRQKISSSTSSPTSFSTPILQPSTTVEHQLQTLNMSRNALEVVEELKATATKSAKELKLGITQYVDDEAPGFTGTLKQRYTDFQVHEITIGGQVVTLCDTTAPDTIDEEQEEDPVEDEEDSTINTVTTIYPTTADGPAFALSTEADEFLIKHFGVDGKDKLLIMYNSIITKPGQKSHGEVISQPILDRELRFTIHTKLRTIFNSQFQSEMTEERGIRVKAQSSKPARGPRQRPQQQGRNQIKGKVGWAEKGGEYVHMTLYKENKDTMEVVGFIARQLHTKPKDFGFAGTKDRRAVTLQRISVRRQNADKLRKLNRTLRGSYLGNFKYEKQGLELGELEGNLFVVTLRDCDFDFTPDMDEPAKLKLAKERVGRRVQSLQEHGFINYFGLQRFGTFGIGTDIVGLRILKDDFEGAVNAILAYDPELLGYSEASAESNKINKDDVDRAKAIHQFLETGSSQLAKTMMPKKFSSELNIINHLSSNRKDYLGALHKVNRNIKTMYVHAYQSLVWNTVASERWIRYGAKVIKGDLVLVDTQGEKAAVKDEVDENGEIVIHPAAHDTAVSHDDIYQRARALTAEEAESGRYTIFDVVLPTPGFDVNYPDNFVGDYYKEFMSSERGGGIDPGNMRRSQKDFSLSGSYRPLMGTVSKDMTFEVRSYRGANTQLVETDLEKLRKSRSHSQQKPQSGPSKGASTTSPTNSRGRNSPPSYYRTRDQELAKARETVNAKAASLSAWQNAASTISQADKVSVAEAQAERARVKAEDLSGPSFKDTWHETTEIGSKRTGNKVVEVLGEEKIAPTTIAANGGATTTPNTQSTSPYTAHANTPGIATPDTAAAMPFPSTPEQGNKRGAENISTSAPSSPQSQDVVPTPELEPARIAVILTFSLGPSQYATMALRELMRSGGVRSFQTEFTNGQGA